MPASDAYEQDDGRGSGLIMIIPVDGGNFATERGLQKPRLRLRWTAKEFNLH